MTANDKIDEIMDWFDFSKVAKVMEAVDWKWWSEEGIEVPCEGKLRKEARRLLKRAIKERGIIGTGGFEASYIDGDLELKFIVSSWGHYDGECL